MASLIVPDHIDFSAYMDATDAAHRVTPAPRYVDDVIDYFHGEKRDHGQVLPWRKTHGLMRFRPGEVTLWSGLNGHGKALCLETEIPTPAGWMRMGDIRPGDVVFDERGKPCNVVADTQVQIGRPCFRVLFSDGTWIIADAEHEWVTETAAGRPGRHGSQTVTTREIAATVHGTGCRERLANHSIAVAGSLSLPVADLPIPPYALGAWLGDGTSSDSSITSNDPEVIREIEACGFPCVKSASRLRYGIRGGFYRLLRLNGLLNNKHIPPAYLRASDAQRLELLRGLMDTDGHVTDYGRCEFTAMRKHLAEQTLELVLSLGWQAKMVIGEATISGKKCGTKYRVTFTPDRPVFRMARKVARCTDSISDRAKRRYIVACEPVDSVPVKCIQVDSPSRLYLASRAFIPTHNSQVLGMVSLWLVPQQQKTVIASLEMKPVVTLARMCRQAACEARPTPDVIRTFHELTDGRLWLYDQQGAVHADKMLAVIRYCADKLGINHFILDSLLKCGIGEDDYNGQKAFIDQITSAARDYQIHIHLVAHSRKGRDENTPPGKMDVRGSSSITDQVDNVLTVWRNKPKEREQRENDPKFDPNAPDCMLICDKQRNGEWEGAINLWFRSASMLYVDHPDMADMDVTSFVVGT